MEKSYDSTSFGKKKIVVCVALLLLLFSLIYSQTLITSAEEAESRSVSTPYLEDGVYALRNSMNDCYARVRPASLEPGNRLQQYNYGHMPETDAERVGLFKIERVGATNRYIVRTMQNNYLGLSYRESDHMIVTAPVSIWNSYVPSDETWVIEYDSSAGGYRLSPYGSDLVMSSTTNTTTTTTLLLQDPTAVGARGVWEFIPLDDDITIRGIGYRGEKHRDIVTGKTYTDYAYMYSTLLTENAVTVYLRDQDEGVATVSCNVATGAFTTNALQDGQVKHIVAIKNTSGNIVTPFPCDYVNIRWGSGIYTFKNPTTEKYMLAPEETVGSRLKGEVEGDSFDIIPDAEYERMGLFKVIYRDDGSYVIRSMMSNQLLISFEPVGQPHPRIKNASTDNDQQIAIADTWNFARTEDGYYQFITNQDSTGIKAIGIRNGSNYLTMLDCTTNVNNTKWDMQPYTGAEITGFSAADCGSHIVENGGTKDMSAMEDTVFYTTNLNFHSPGSIVQYIVQGLDGSYTNVASINSYGILTANNQGHPGLVQVCIEYETGVLSYPLNIYIEPGEGDYFLLQNAEFEATGPIGTHGFNVNSNIRYVQNVNGVLKSAPFSFDRKQVFRRDDAGDGYYRILNFGSSVRYMDSSSTAANSPIAMSAVWETAVESARRQLWRFTNTPSGAQKLQSADLEIYAPDLYMNMPDGIGTTVVKAPWVNNQDVSDEFNVTRIGNEVVLLGMDEHDSRYDRTVTMPDTAALLSSHYDSFGYHLNVFTTKSTALELLEQSKVFVFRGHGNDSVIRVGLNNDDTDLISKGDLSTVSLDGVDMVLLLGCSTADASVDIEDTITYAAYAAGAEVVLGTTDTIYSPPANEWLKQFMYLMDQNYTVDGAMQMTNSQVFGCEVTCIGNGDFTLP